MEKYRNALLVLKPTESTNTISLTEPIGAQKDDSLLPHAIKDNVV